MKKKFGVGTEPRTPRRTSSNARYIPAHVRRAVYARDQGQCTFVSDKGKRCGATRFLQMDHIVPVARGGQPSLEGLRLRCGPHNRLEAARALGAGFVQAKREDAQRSADERRAQC